MIIENNRAIKAASLLTGGLNNTVLVRFGSVAMASPISESLYHFFSGVLLSLTLFSAIQRGVTAETKGLKPGEEDA